ncbi:MAG: DUF2333 family protein [Gammaproteobacteria bacterium]|nr:DUF2333 family protein [Gammaproteobacteria bacterium]
MKILDHLFDVYDRLRQLIVKPLNLSEHHEQHWAVRIISGLIIVLIVVQIIFGFLWNSEPDAFDVVDNASAIASAHNEDMVTGYITTATLIKVGEILLDKPGGYLSNDMMPPGVFMDNIPNWEFGVLVQMRDLASALRKDISRSQSQSIEDKDLIIAEPRLNFDNDSWLLPASESEYRTALKALRSYLRRLADTDKQDGQFFARADNLKDWLALVEKRLGSLSQRLSASVGQQRINTDLAGDAEAQQSTPAASIVETKTPWTEIDDIFYEARGSAWALSHFLKAVETDFQDILQKKNALISLRQIIRELDATQDTVWSPVILNGGGFGFFANHSLVMANYISRANAAMIELRILLSQG